MGNKNNIQELEEHNLALWMENIELIWVLEIVEEEKRHMHFVLQQFLDEKVTEIFTPTPTRETSE